MLHRFLQILFFIFWSAHAAATIVTTNSESRSTSFFAGAQAATIKFDQGVVTGYGLTLGSQYLLTNKIAAEMSFNQIYGTSANNSASGSVQAIGTAIQTGVLYSVLGSLGKTNKTYQINGQPVVQLKNLRRWNTQVGVGFDQYWFNGTDAVYPASGLCYFITGELPIWKDHWVKPTVRFASLTSGQGDPITVTQYLLAFSFYF